MEEKKSEMDGRKERIGRGEKGRRKTTRKKWNPHDATTKVNTEIPSCTTLKNDFSFGWIVDVYS